MKGKSLFANIIIALLASLASESALFPPSLQAWIGAITAILTILLSTFFASGYLPKGWTALVWITNGMAFIVQAANILAAHQVISAGKVTMIIILINVLVQGFIKNYPGGGTGILGNSSNT